MPTLARVRVGFTGFPGAPGVCTFYCLDPATWRPDLIAFWAAVTPTMPYNVESTVEASGDLIDEVSGDITGTWTSGTPATVEGTVTGLYSGPSGASINWLTNTVINNRRVRGRTFVVPLGGTQYDDQGSLLDGMVTFLAGEVATLIAASPGQQLVYHQKTVTGQPPGPHAATYTSDGQGCPVTAGSVPDRVAVLRSRRG